MGQRQINKDYGPVCAIDTQSVGGGGLRNKDISRCSKIPPRKENNVKAGAFTLATLFLRKKLNISDKPTLTNQKKIKHTNRLNPYGTFRTR